MMRSLTRLVQIIGFIIIPFGVILYLQQTLALCRTVTDSVVSTVAALIGMIPEGLYLLVSVALTVSVVRLAQKKTLVHDLGCIETLARVDVLCVDKTGTITENKMTVREVVPLLEDRFGLSDIASLMADYTAVMGTDNETMTALKRYSTANRAAAPSVCSPSPRRRNTGASRFLRAGHFSSARRKKSYWAITININPKLRYTHPRAAESFCLPITPVHLKTRR